MTATTTPTTMDSAAASSATTTVPTNGPTPATPGTDEGHGGHGRRGWRLRQWLGWSSGEPVLSARVADDGVSVLALRAHPWRVTGSGWAPLPPGAVRDGHVRLVGAVADALRGLRDDLRVPGDGSLVLVVDDPVLRAAAHDAASATAREAGSGELVLDTASDATARARATSVVRPDRVPLVPAWELLVGAGLGRLGVAPPARVTALPADRTTTWTAERIDR